ncbi:hypothetical protein Micbo1qcDRAFT_160625 [Microdochium bolleyi]|uniref:Secreted protein n=1 Tax=Microdochium bolleyi TaxID=196109 RepID=A0A136J6I9_9PEZI|nr:hypothetical protein Micbo1qcDRAFT_160625 [Microdochium bolleyi]
MTSHFVSSFLPFLLSVPSGSYNLLPSIGWAGRRYEEIGPRTVLRMCLVVRRHATHEPKHGKKENPENPCWRCLANYGGLLEKHPTPTPTTTITTHIISKRGKPASSRENRRKEKKRKISFGLRR